MGRGLYINGKNVSSLTRTDEDYKGRGREWVWDRPEKYEPVRSTDFELVVDFSSDAGAAGNSDPIYDVTGAIDAWDPNEASDFIRYAVISCNMPSLTINVLEDRRINQVAKYAGTPSWSDGQITVRDFIGVRSGELLRSWMNLAYNINTGKTGLKSEYDKNAQLIQYAPDGHAIRRWELTNVWPASVEEEPMNHENEQSLRTITCNFVFDNAKLQLPDQETSGGAGRRTAAIM